MRTSARISRLLGEPGRKRDTWRRGGFDRTFALGVTFARGGGAAAFAFARAAGCDRPGLWGCDRDLAVLREAVLAVVLVAACDVLE